MKNYFMKLFDLENGELEVKDFLAAGASLVIAISVVFLPLFFY